MLLAFSLTFTMLPASFASAAETEATEVVEVQEEQNEETVVEEDVEGADTGVTTGTEVVADTTEPDDGTTTEIIEADPEETESDSTVLPEKSDIPVETELIGME